MSEKEFRCPTCNGEGWGLHDKKTGRFLAAVVVKREKEVVSEWWEYCPTCKGTCSFSLGFLAKKLDEDPRTIERLMEPKARSRVTTCVRILDKLISLMGDA